MRLPEGVGHRDFLDAIGSRSVGRSGGWRRWDGRGGGERRGAKADGRGNRLVRAAVARKVGFEKIHRTIRIGQTAQTGANGRWTEALELWSV
jgi:hypothetical protein